MDEDLEDAGAVVDILVRAQNPCGASMCNGDDRTYVSQWLKASLGYGTV